MYVCMYVCMHMYICLQDVNIFWGALDFDPDKHTEMKLLL